MKESRKGGVAIPVAIVIAGALIAAAVIYVDNSSSNITSGVSDEQREQNKAEDIVREQSLDNLSPVTAEDHVRGDRDAPITIVEYSDYECPFCKRFHETMLRVMEEYGDSGKVAWVYRHFPIDSLHPVKARAEAVASECAAELGGGDAFWQFSDRFYERTPSNNQTNIDVIIPKIIQEIAIDADAFENCYTSGKYDEHIQQEYENAVRTGGRGTPWSIIVTKDGQKFPINGAQPYASLKALIEGAL